MQTRTWGMASTKLPRKKERPMQSIVKLLLICFAAVLPAAAQAQAEPAGEARYVWASNLIMRATPDAKGKEVARLPYGTKVLVPADAAPPVAHRETLTTLHASAAHPAADVVLDGNWRQVQAQGKAGWVFDGWLSRYPAPGNAKSPEAYDDAEIAYAAQVFGVAHAWQWKNGDGKKSDAYRVMRRKWKLDENKGASEIYWTRVEFKLGGAAEMGRIMGDGATENLALEGMPLTFNEALLWWHHFRFFTGSGVFEPGHKLDAGPTDEESDALGFDRIIECGKQTCDIKRDLNN